MSFEIPGFLLTLEAAADLTAEQYTGVVVDANGKAAQAGNGADAIGILQNKPNTGQAATIMVNGVSIVKAGTGGLTAGDDVGMDANGEAVNAASTDAVIGIALETFAAGEYGAVLLRPQARLHA